MKSPSLTPAMRHAQEMVRPIRHVRAVELGMRPILPDVGAQDGDVRHVPREAEVHLVAAEVARAASPERRRGGRP